MPSFCPCLPFKGIAPLSKEREHNTIFPRRFQARREWCDPATGRWEGFGIEIAERLAAELGVRAEFVRTSWPTLAENVRANPPLFDKPFSHGEIGVLMRSGQNDLLAFVNDVLDRMASDGSLDTLKAKHGLTPSP